MYTKNISKTPIRYAGGKTKAIKHIFPFIENYEEIVSPFLGGGSLEVYLANTGKKVIAGELFDILVVFWQTLLESPEALANELEQIQPTKEEYARIKEELLATPETQKMLENWKTDSYKREVKKLDRIKLAAYYYFNHNCSYGPGFLGWPSSLYMKEKSWKKMISNIRNFKCENLSVSCSSFENTIQKHPDSFLYLDPPYLLNENKSSDNKMFAGIYPMRNIPVHHNNFDHKKLKEMLDQHEGDFVLSYNNCEEIRDMYHQYDFHYPSWHYSMSLGEKRIGKNREKNDKRDATKDSHEILIVKKKNK